MTKPTPFHGALVALLAAILFVPGAARAIEVSAQVDRTVVDVDGRVYLTVTVEGAGRQSADVDLGATDAFQVYSAGTSQNISIVNGQFNATYSYKYVLTPKRKGKFQIGPISVQGGGKRATTGAITIEVVEGAGDAGAPTPGRSGSGRPSTNKQPDEVMIKTVVDRRSAYVGEAVTLTFQLFTRVRFWSDPEYTPPSTEGFWKEDLPPQNRYNTEVDGAAYRVTEIKTALFPTKPGELTIGPARLSFEGNTLGSGDPFDIFSGMRRGIRGGRGKRELETDPITIRALPLPEEGKPKGFTGTVGRFDLRASIDRDEVKANEPITLTVEITGEGNIRTANIADLEMSESFKVYDSGASSDISKENYRVRGKKTYTRVVVPRYGGEYTIPPVSFSFFDPKRKEYVTRKSASFPIKVDGPAHDPETEKREVERRKSDLHYLKGDADPEWAKRGGSFPAAAVIAGNALPLALLGIGYTLRKRRDRLSSDRIWARRQRADGEARKALSRAKSALDGPDPREFAARLDQALQGYIRDKGNLPVGALTRRDLIRELRGRGLDEELADRLERLLRQCDRGRFAGASLGTDERRTMLREGEEIVLLAGRVLGAGEGSS